jgi:hypothetical protein
LKPAHREVYSIQHYVIKFVSGLQQIGGLSHKIVTSRIQTHNFSGVRH